MRIEQAHYTSCRQGTAPVAGFMVRACSPGLDGQAGRIQSAVAYEAPLTLPVAPTPEQISDEFPVRIRFQPAAGGRWTFSRTVYSGTDHTRRRWGNYFGHYLEGDQRLPPGHPIALAEWAGWVSGYALDDDLQPPPPLSPVAPDSLPPLSGLPSPAIAKFVTGPERVAQLAQILDAVRGRLRGGPVVYVCAPGHELVAWASAALTAFPCHLVASLGFCTYQWQEADPLDLNFSTDGTQIDLESGLWRRGVCLVDLRAAPAQGQQSVFAQWAAASLVAGPAEILRFHAFLAGALRNSCREEDLDVALLTFRMLSRVEVPAGTLSGTLRWAVRELGDDSLRQLVAREADALRSDPEPVPGWLGPTLGRLGQHSDPSSRELAADLATDRFEPALRGSALSSWRAAVEQAGPALRPEIARRLFALVLDGSGAAQVRSRAGPAAVELLDVLAELAPALGADAETQVDEVCALSVGGAGGIDSLVWGLKRRLAPGATSATSPATWLARWRGRLGEPTWARRVAELLLQRAPLGRRPGLYAALLRADLTTVVLAAITIDLLRGPDAWTAWRKELAGAVLGVLGPVFSGMPETIRPALALAWVLDSTEIDASEDLSVDLLVAANAALVVGTSPPQTVDAVGAAALRRSVTLDPDRPRLDHAMRTESLAECLALAEHATRLPTGEARAYASGVLQRLGLPSLVDAAARPLLALPDALATCIACARAAGDAEVARMLAECEDLPDDDPVRAQVLEAFRPPPAPKRSRRNGDERAAPSGTQTAAAPDEPGRLPDPAPLTARLRTWWRGLRGGSNGNK